MSFTDIVFLPFVVLVFSAFGLFRRRPTGQVVALLLASYVFYAWWRLDFLALILFSSLVDYAMGAAIHHTANPGRRKLFLIISLTANLGLLGYFKYANFFLAQANRLFDMLHLAPLPGLEIILPVGISFYTFQSMSYTIDIYRRELEPADNPLHFLLFVAAFPQLVAGPIVRARDFLPQLKANPAARSDPSGLWLILYGLFKKLVVADQLGAFIVDPVFGQPNAYSSLACWLAAYGFAFQIFMDFSAYSDIAIGLGRLFGLRLPLNFNAPYLADGPRDFWRRWHITLSTWLRDYLYIPLGGNRGGRFRTGRNLMLTMLLGGLWHGAAGNFIIWGGLHGLYLLGYRSLEKTRAWVILPRWLKAVVFFQLTCLAWIFFRAEGLAPPFEYLTHMFTAGGGVEQITGPWAVLLIGAAALHCLVEPFVHRGAAWLDRLPALANAVAFMALFALIYLLSEHRLTHQAFIYFQF